MTANNYKRVERISPMSRGSGDHYYVKINNEQKESEIDEEQQMWNEINEALKNWQPEVEAEVAD